MAKKDKQGRSGSPSIENRKARHEYHIEETIETGIELVGPEVKSIRQGNASLQDAYCQISGGELWVQNMYIKPYEQTTHFKLDERRPRKLLVHREEIRRLHQRAEAKGMTLIPLKLYFSRGWAKLLVGLGRGKKLYDKRESIKERDLERERRRGGE